MANTEMIRAYIRDSGYKLQYIARAMQISTTALTRSCRAERSSSWTRPSGSAPCLG